MNLEAMKHIPLSEDAFAISEDTIVLRIRTKKNDIKQCRIFYGDRVCITNPIIMNSTFMYKLASDAMFDYYEVEIKSLYTRICYYFKLEDDVEEIYYFGGQFKDSADFDRTEYFQFPYIRREDIVDVPEWAQNAVMYQIFPDSFATSQKKLEVKGKVEFTQEGFKVVTHNGGTLQGIIDNIDYLIVLGINCIYLNPIFTASSYHKYDTIDYFSVDPCLGDMNTFKELVKSCHKNGIKVLLDGVFNHCGSSFIGFQDVLKHGEKSEYKDWFYQLNFPVNYKNPPNYEAFAYVKEMPKLNTGNPVVADYFCSVGKYWIEEADIDGWRLDVANEINHDFWRQFRKSVRSIKPDAFLIGEIWEDSQVWLQGDQFDSTMNYKFSNICRSFFAEESISVDEFNSLLETMLMRYQRNMTYTQMNLLDSHDVPRFLSKCGEDVQKLTLALLFMFTFVGIPSIFYGDEKAMLGVTESEYRRPMIWDDGNRELDLVEKTAKMISLRKNNKALIYGNYKCLSTDNEESIYMFSREYQDKKIIIVINNGKELKQIPLPIGEYRKILFTLNQDYIDRNMITVNAQSGIVIEC